MLQRKFVLNAIKQKYPFVKDRWCRFCNNNQYSSLTCNAFFNFSFSFQNKLVMTGNDNNTKNKFHHKVLIQNKTISNYHHINYIDFSNRDNVRMFHTRSSQEEEETTSVKFSEEELKLISISSTEKNLKVKHGKIAEQLKKMEKQMISKESYFEVLRSRHNKQTLSICYSDMKRRKIRFNFNLYAFYIEKFGNKGDFHMVESLLNELKNKQYTLNIVIYNILIRNYGAYKKYKEMEMYYKEMIKEGIQPDNITYNILINQYSQSNKTLQKVHYYYNEMKKNRYNKYIDDNDDNNKSSIHPDIYTYATLIQAFGKRKEFEKVDIYLKEMEKYKIEPNIVIYNILMDIYCKNKDEDKVIFYFNEMQIHDIEPDIFSYTALITLHGNMEKMEQVKMYIDEMKNKGISLTGETYGLLIEIYGRVSNYDAIDNLLKEMKSRNIRLDYRIHSILTKIYTDVDHLNKVDLYFDKNDFEFEDMNNFLEYESNKNVYSESYSKEVKNEDNKQLFVIDTYKETLQKLMIKSMATKKFDSITLFLYQMEMYYKEKNQNDIDFYNQLIEICITIGHYEKSLDYFYVIKNNHFLAPNSETKRLFKKQLTAVRKERNKQKNSGRKEEKQRIREVRKEKKRQIFEAAFENAEKTAFDLICLPESEVERLLNEPYTDPNGNTHKHEQIRWMWFLKKEEEILPAKVAEEVDAGSITIIEDNIALNDDVEIPTFWNSEDGLDHTIHFKLSRFLRQEAFLNKCSEHYKKMNCSIRIKRISGNSRWKILIRSLSRE